MKINKQTSENYLERIPLKNPEIKWTTDENGMVTLQVENKGLANKIAQKLLKKPKISYIHLDENGSFIWPLIDGERDIIAIGEKVKEHFGEKANPLYERLVKFFQILENYSFVNWKK